MGRLVHAGHGAAWVLAERSVVGRSRVCLLRVDAPETSGEHALLRWSGGVWRIQDLGSRNGTFVEGRRLDPREPAVLAPGMVVGFGRPDGYVFADAAAPQPFAVPLDEEADPVLSEGGLLALPAPERPELTIFGGASGWSIEQADEVREIESGAVVRAGGRMWRVHLPEALPPTGDVRDVAPSVASFSLQFRVSPDEEYVELLAFHGGGMLDLKARTHHHSLLLLARARLAARDQPPEAQGWVHQAALLAQLRSGPNRLYLDIYRIRRQLTEAGIPDAPAIIERRPGTRQLRIGVDKIEIVPLNPA